VTGSAAPLTAPPDVAPLQGIAACAGWAIAKAHVLTHHALTVAHHHISAGQVADEQATLRAAFAAAHDELNQLEAQTAQNSRKELSALLEVHRLMLGDPVLFDAALDYIAQNQVNAAWALSEQVQRLVMNFEAMEDAYLSERALDVRQIGQRVLAFLALLHAAQAPPEGLVASTVPPKKRDEPIILVARDLAPADFAHWEQITLAGLVTELGGPASHTAIMARAHGIPAVLGIAQAVDTINDGDVLALNGNTGELWIKPSEQQLNHLLAQQIAWNAQQACAQGQVTQPAITACGQAVMVYANIEHITDMPYVNAAGLDGVGLFRSEFLFLGRDALPSEDEQYAAYSAVVCALNGKPATIRTLDVGADKILNGAHAADTAASPNPALGLRAVRYCLAKPELFVTQLRALLRAAAHGPVKVLLPMVSSADEVLACQRWLLLASSELTAQGILQGAVELGVMIEIPAAAIAIDTLLPHVDFCSVGTNDLIQYTLAIDRTDAQVAHLYNPAHPAITALLSQVFTACAAAGKPVSVCGEMAGDTTQTHALLSLGLRQFSVNPSQAASVKAAIRAWACAK
jgi:phosphoenolpyruvate-protein phosphotransferase (PTS system enzyme I)